ncbi:MAG: alpha/beta hydrolase, partial [Planctomycetota bacterium]
MWVTTHAYGDLDSQALDLHAQGRRVGEWQWFERAREARPTLVWFHGGGWIQGDKTTETPMLIPFLERGWNVVNVNYRLGNATAP